MSSRFHNKYHRHNHHTLGTDDPRYPDAGSDPIASYSSPFLGNFVMLGSLSASVYQYSSDAVNYPAGFFTGYRYGIRAIARPDYDGIAVDAIGHASVTGTLSAGNMFFTGNVLKTYNTPVTATGDFLELVVNGQLKAIRLWNVS